MIRMDNVNVNFGPGAKVRLRKDVDPSIYGDFACVGNEGWVEDGRLDRFGLPEILLKWDKNHWAYNGVPDCWTFAEHFELVPIEEDDNMADKKEQIQKIALDFASQLANAMGEDQGDQTGTAPVGDITSRINNAGNIFGNLKARDEYSEAVEVVHQRLAEADGFIVIGVDREGDVFAPFAFGNSRTDKGELAVQAHLAGVAARAHQDLALQMIAAMSDES